MYHRDGNGIPLPLNAAIFMEPQDKKALCGALLRRGLVLQDEGDLRRRILLPGSPPLFLFLGRSDKLCPSAHNF